MKKAQTFVFLMVSLAVIFLICGLGIDTGLLYLAKARLARAVDAASLAAVGNFSLPTATSAEDNRQKVAKLMRNVAVANYSDLLPTYNGQVGPTVAGGTPITLPNGLPGTEFEYDFYTSTATGPATPEWFKVYVQTGANGAILEADCAAAVPTHTYFMGFAGASFNSVAVLSSSQAKRNPRLVMVVLDRSASMIKNGGAQDLPNAVANFMSYFDPTNDSIGVVSFASNARLEFPLTTNFDYAVTNSFRGALDSTTLNQPGEDPEDVLPAQYAFYGPRRLKFGGATSADEGIRVALEQLMSNSSFQNPDVQKYLVIFTDGAWNSARTLVAAPGYTNVMTFQPTNSTTIGQSSTATVMPLLTSYAAYSHNTNSGTPVNEPLAWYNALGTGTSPQLSDHTDDILMSADKNSEAAAIEGVGAIPVSWQSTGGLPTEGAPKTINAVNNNHLSGTNYAYSINVWVPIGGVDYTYRSGVLDPTSTIVSRLSEAAGIHLGANHTVTINGGNAGEFRTSTSNVMVVPGYIIDGIVANSNGNSDGNGYNLDNWSDAGDGSGTPNNGGLGYFPDTAGKILASPSTAQTQVSKIRGDLFRNFMNLLTGFQVYDPYDPPQVGVGSLDTNIWITDTGSPAAQFTKPLHGLGQWYPGAPTFFCFNDMVLAGHGAIYAAPQPGGNAVTGAPGTLYPGCPTVDINTAVDYSAPSDAGKDFESGFRGGNYSSVPQQYTTVPWNGQLFYFSTGLNGAYSVGATTNSVLETSASVTGSRWQNISSASESWIGQFDQMSYYTNQYYNSSNSALLNASVLKPYTYRGFDSGLTDSAAHIHTIVPGVSFTPPSPVTGQPITSSSGGYLIDDLSGGTGEIYYDTMGYSGRPTHYYDFSVSSWVPISDNHYAGNYSSAVTVSGRIAGAEVDAGCQQFAHLCFWKSMEYCYHARAMGVNVFTVGYSSAVNNAECDVLGQIANAQTYQETNLSGGHPISVSNPNFDPTQPVGQMYYATTAAEINQDFSTIAASVTGYLSD